MKRLLTLFLTGIILIACTSENEPETNGSKQSRKLSLKTEQNIKYLEWLKGDYETVLSYSFLDEGSMEEAIVGMVSRYTGVNTIQLNENISIRYCDTCQVETNKENTIFHFTREVTDIFQKENRKRLLSPRDVCDDVPISSLSFDITLRTASPIYFIRPRATRCNSIPLCYYEDMEVEWNPDPENRTGVVVIAEWNGISMDGSSTGETIAHSVEVDDTGCTTLPNEIFEGMPDEALVNLWLVRANIEIVESGQTLTLPDIISVANEDPDGFMEFMYANPTTIIALHEELSLATGAISIMPIYLIRNL